MQGGKLNLTANFKKPSSGKDQFGQIESGFIDAFSAQANVAFRRGGEGVLAARLEAKSPAIITVRASSDTKQIRAAWAVEIDGELFNIRERPRLTQNRLYLEFLAESGVSV